ncbi:hypothetical protein MUP77_21455 [Candidatus Bathyarchaeota archaeon]|nr:hypothetical protein [Candidatus Bathyarchaeota archaeon]
MNRILIKCDKCGSTRVSDSVLEEPPKITVLTMDEYIAKNKARSVMDFMKDIDKIQGVSHMEKRVFKCLDCGYERLWDQLVYT